MLKITAIGNLTNDVELKCHEDGKPYAILRIASDRRYRDREGNKLTDFISIKVRGALAERCAAFAWKGCKIALRLKPDIEARARANQQEYHGNQYDSGLSATLPEVHSDPVDTRRELADAVGLGERTMGKVMQIDEHAPTAVKEALDSGDLSINQGYNITRQVRELPEEQRDEAAALAVELEKAKKEIRQCDAEADRRGRIADLFCKAFEKAVLLTPTEENVRIWTECTRMTREEIEDSVKDARELAEVFTAIADILETLLPGGDGDAGCSGTASRCPSATRASPTPSPSRRCPCSPRGTPPC